MSCSQSDSSPYNPLYAQHRTVMVYMLAENSLSPFVAADVVEMLKGVKNQAFYPGDRLVIYLDDAALPRIYMLDRNTTASSMGQMEPVLTYSNDVNSASAQQLGEFVNYVKTHYPADSYGLVMWSHASGWIPSTYSGDYSAEARRRSFGVDNGENSPGKNVGNQMEVAQMAQALEEQGGVDFIFFDACFMQTIEVAYQLRNAATQYVIGSPAEIPDLGSNYQTMVPAMFRQDDYADAMLSAYYAEYGALTNWGLVVSAIHTPALPAFAASMRQWVEQERDALLGANYKTVLNYFRYGYADRRQEQEGIKYERWGTGYPDFYDMQGVMLNSLSSDDMARWLDEVDGVVQCMHADRWYSGKMGGMTTYPIDSEQCCGVSMFLPLAKYDDDGKNFNASFEQTDWAQKVWK